MNCRLWLIQVTLHQIIFYYIGDNRGELGPGLATNYWYGLLQTLMLEDDDIDSLLTDYLRHHKLDAAGDNHMCYDKLILLIPDNCHFNSDKLQQVLHEVTLNTFSSLPNINLPNSHVLPNFLPNILTLYLITCLTSSPDMITGLSST